MARGDLGELVIQLSGDSAKFEKTLEKAEVRIKKFSRKISKLGSRLTRRLTLPLTAMAAIGVKAFADFDSAITKSVAIMTGVTADLRAEMEATARTLSTTTVTSAKDAADAFFFLASAGLNAKQAIAALPVVERFAVAGAFDMAKATDLLTDAQSALGLTTKDTATNLRNMVRVSDILVKANTLASASVEQFSKSLVSKAAAALRLLNKDMEEGVAVLAAFADQGIKGELAGNALSIVLRDLQKAATKQPKVWKALNIRVFDAEGKMRNVADIVEDLTKKFSKMSDEQKKTAASLLGFQDRSFSFIQSLLGMSGKIRDYEKALRSAGGTTEKVANIQLTSFSSQMTILKNKLTDVAITLGKDLVPAIKFIAGFVESFVKSWKELTVAARRFIVVIGIMLAIVGPALKLLAFLMTPWLFAVVALTVGIVLLADTIVAMVNQTKPIFNDMVQNFKIGGTTIREGMLSAINAITLGWNQGMILMQRGFNLFMIAVKTGAKIAFAVFAFEAKRAVTQTVFILNVVVNLLAKAIQKIVNLIPSGLAKMLPKFATRVQLSGALATSSILSQLAGIESPVGVAVTATGQIRKELEKTKGLMAAAKEQAKNVTRIQALEAKRRAGLAAKFKPPGPRDTKPATSGRTVAEILPKLERQVSAGRFQQISLRRFALSGPGGLTATAAKKEQKVKDTDVAKKLDKLISVTKTQKPVTVLG